MRYTRCPECGKKGLGKNPFQYVKGKECKYCGARFTYRDGKLSLAVRGKK